MPRLNDAYSLVIDLLNQVLESPTSNESTAQPSLIDKTGGLGSYILFEAGLDQADQLRPFLGLAQIQAFIS